MAASVWILSGLSALAALGYGLLYLNKPPSLLRAVVKTLFMGALFAALILLGAPTLLLLAAFASAVGDAAFAFDKKWVLPVGIASFLIAQISYLMLFRQLGADTDLDGPRFMAMGALAWFTLVFLVWLWPKLGQLVYAVVPYSLAITAMAVSAMLLPPAGWPAMLGAVFFFVSDGVLSGELFQLPPNAPVRRITGPVVWWTYVAAQALIIWGVMRVLTAH